MMHSRVIVLILAVAALATGCSKENKLAKDLDGTWTLSYQWTGDENNLPAVFDNVGTWTLDACKPSKETCFAVYSGDDDGNITFEWTVLDGAESMQFTVIDTQHWMNQFNGTYEIFSQTDALLVLTSTDCVGCLESGGYTISLSK